MEGRGGGKRPRGPKKNAGEKPKKPKKDAPPAHGTRAAKAKVAERLKGTAKCGGFSRRRSSGDEWTYAHCGKPLVDTGLAKEERGDYCDQHQKQRHDRAERCDATTAKETSCTNRRLGTMMAAYRNQERTEEEVSQGQVYEGKRCGMHNPVKEWRRCLCGCSQTAQDFKMYAVYDDVVSVSGVSRT